MERLSHLIEDLVVGGLWKPIFTSKGGPPLSHLLFANDLFLFGEASIDQARVIKGCLQQFYDA